MAYTRDEWNDLLTRVNDIITDPPDGCDPLTPLDLVGPNHRWAKSDVRAVHEKLKETCEDISFSDIPDLWKQVIIDEIEAALGETWCDCEECECEDEEVIVLDWAIPHVDCGITCGVQPCPGSEPGFFNWFASAQAFEGFGPNIGGSIQMIRRSFNDEGPILGGGGGVIYSNTFDCAGNQKPKTAPTVSLLESRGQLPVVSIVTIIGGFCTPEQFAAAEADHAIKQAELAASLALNPRVQYVVRKLCPEGFEGGSGPCLECCEDGVGFVGIDCPSPPPEEEG